MFVSDSRAYLIWELMGAAWSLKLWKLLQNYLRIEICYLNVLRTNILNLVEKLMVKMKKKSKNIVAFCPQEYSHLM